VRHVRDRVMIATKFGVRLRSDGAVRYDSTPEWAETSLYESLSRLDTEYVDLFQVHYWDRTTPITATFECLEKLRARGLIRSYGITNYAPDLSKLAADFPGLASVSLEYSLVERSSETFAKQVLHHGLNFLSYGSLGQGVLSGKYGSYSKFSPGDRRARVEYRNFHGARFRANLALVAALQEQAEALSLTLPQLALAWILSRIPGSIPLVGIKTVAQLEDAVGALRVRPTSAVLSELDRLSQAIFKNPTLATGGD
jgi:myo-inositol catabolism protein IolS